MRLLRCARLRSFGKLGVLKEPGMGFHGILFFAAFLALNAAFPSLAWPWYLVLPLAIYAVAVAAIGPLRRTAPRLAIGRLYGWPLVYAGVLALGSVAVLVGFQMIAQPDAAATAGKFPIGWFGDLLLAGAVFCTINAVAEELIFRGILWEVIAREWGQATALVVTSGLFGLVHLHGYPPGPTGAVLAGLYAIALGILRWWTGGLGLAIACHIAADATIFRIATAD